MDDLKLYACNDKALHNMVTATHLFSRDISMNFGIEKCAKVTLKRGRQTSSENVTLEEDFSVQDLVQGTDYKYLGVEEDGGISHNKMKQKIRKELYRRARKILQTELNSKNKIMALNSLAVPVVSYSFNIINWTINEIKQMDVKIRKLLTMHRMHHPKADKDRIYLPRPDGGRGLIQLENAYKVSTIGLLQYLENSQEETLKSVYRHHCIKKMHSIIKEGKTFKQEIKLTTEDDSGAKSCTPIENAKRTKEKAKKLLQKSLQQRWEEKRLYGQFPKRVAQEHISKHLSYQWLKTSGMKGETEGLILAAQDQSLPTRNYQTNITKELGNDLCRLCKAKPETIDHLISGCESIAATEYLQRHNNIAQYIHWNICRTAGMNVAAKWYEHRPEPVQENEELSVLWDFTIHTDRKINANRPDITVKDRKNQECFLIDVSVPSDRNVAKKEFEKKYKYSDLELEIQRMWKFKTKVIPIVIGALGTISEDFEKYKNEIPGDMSTKEIQKTALMGTAHILRKTLNMK